jgi:DNA primase
MALEQHGSTLARLLKASLKPPMAEAMASRIWRDALSQIHVAQLENNIEQEYQSQSPDPARLQQLLTALAEARQHARQPFVSPSPEDG